MSFREKSAWVTVTSILLVSGFYFLHVPWSLTPAPSPQLVHGLAYCLIAFVLIEVIAHVVLAIRAPRDARTPKDERERLVELKATRAAAYVYVVGTFLAISSIHIGANKGAIGYGVLLAFVVAEVVNYTARIVFYRRGV